jgi:hypothetical protein
MQFDFGYAVLIRPFTDLFNHKAIYEGLSFSRYHIFSHAFQLISKISEEYVRLNERAPIENEYDS